MTTRIARSSTLLGVLLVACGGAAPPAASAVAPPPSTSASASPDAGPSSSGRPPPASREPTSGAACPGVPAGATDQSVDERCGDESACTRACRGGQSAACVAAGNLETSTAQPDVSIELFVYGRACEMGNVLGCTNYGATLRLHEKDPARLACAADLFARACEAREAYGCAMLGGAYMDGEGVPRDGSKALTALLKGCDISLAHHDGVAIACEELATLLRAMPSDPTVKASIERAERIACDAGSAKACANLGRPAPPTP